jgi:hypothetical protein
MSKKYEVQAKEDFQSETVMIRLVEKDHGGPGGRLQRKAIILSLTPEWLDKNLFQIGEGESIPLVNISPK